MNHRLSLLLSTVAGARLFFALVIWWHHRNTGFLAGDSGDYTNLAESLLHGSFAHGLPEIIRTPGYPLLLAPAAWFGHIIALGIAENVTLAIGSAWLIWRIVIDFTGNQRAASFAVLLYCFEPVGLIYSLQIMTETLFCFLILLFTWLLLRYLSAPGFVRLTMSASALAAATYVRPVSLYLPLWLVPLFVLIPQISRPARRMRAAAIFLGVFALALAPWVVRNIVQTDYAGFSSISDFNLYFWCTAEVKAKLDHTSFEEAQHSLGFQHYYEVHPEQRSWTPGAMARFWHAESVPFLEKHSSVFAFSYAKGLTALLFHVEGSKITSSIGIYPRDPRLLSNTVNRGESPSALWLARTYPLAAGVFALLGIALLGYYTLALLGCRRLPVKMKIVFAFIISYFVLISAPTGAARYRAPIMPLMCIAGGSTLAALSRAREVTELLQPASSPA